MSDIVVVIVALGALVVVHELGHLATAKVSGIGVRIFSLGFGPALMARTFGGTEYRLSAVPFGGYISFKEPDSGLEISGRPFETSPLHLRALVVAAGPVTNLLFALALCWGLFWVNGLSVLPPTVGLVMPEGAAQEGGMRVGDTILSIDGSATPYWEDVAELVAASDGKTITVTVMRKDQLRPLTVVPKRQLRQTQFGDFEFVGYLGISSTGPRKTVHLTGFEAARVAVQHTWNIIAMTGKAFAKLAQGDLPLDAVGGPIMITQAISEHAQSGLATLMAIIAVISVNLGMVNLLPLPVLDGGYLLLFAIEGGRGKPVPEHWQKRFLRVGLFLLIALMAWGTFNDIRRL